MPLLALAAMAVLAAPAVTITYETTPCFGYCPVYRVTVNSDGSGVFEGMAHSRVQGVRRFRITHGQFRAFVARLAPARPARGNISYGYDDRCQGAGAPPTDGASINVVWNEGGRRQRLHYYTGCSAPQVQRALFEAPGLLPIGQWINPPRPDDGHG